MSEKKTILIYGNVRDFHLCAKMVVENDENSVFMISKGILKIEHIEYIFVSDPNRAKSLIYDDYRHSSYMNLVAGYKCTETELLENMEMRKGLHCGAK